MLRFDLVKDRRFELTSGLFHGLHGGFHGVEGPWGFVREIRGMAVEMQFEDNGETEESSLSELKKEMMQEYRKNKAWELNADIQFDECPTGSGKSRPEDFIAVWGYHEDPTPFFQVVCRANDGNILVRLKEVLGAQGFELKMRVEIKDFGTGQGDRINVRTSEEGIGELSRFHQKGWIGFGSDQLQYSGVLDRASWNKSGTFSGLITVSCVAYPCDSASIPKAVLSFPGSGPMPTRILQKMLDEGLRSDATIITAEGEAIKCHQFILTGYSDAFEEMFKETSESTESITGAIQMDDMDSKSVKALLAYLYLEDIGQAAGDCGVALDLFQAAHKYDIPSLEGNMKQLLSSKPDGWFNVEVAMRLYFYVKNLKNTEELKKKALQIMKKNFSALNELPAYIRLFEGSHAGRHLCADIFLSK